MLFSASCSLTVFFNNGILKSPSEIMDFSIFPYTSVNIFSISETIFLSTQKFYFIKNFSYIETLDIKKGSFLTLVI